MSVSKKTEMATRIFDGAVRGLAATAAMSAFMGFAQWAGALSRQPPKEIIETLLPPLPAEQKNGLAAVSHFAYGTGAGAAYGVLVPPRWRNIPTGVGFGVLVWAAGYEGWLPALGVFPAAHHDQPGRGGTMLLAHVVFGAALGASSKRSKTAKI